MRVLLVDHYDSFTWNLAHQVAEHAGGLPEVVAHDDAALARLDWADFDAVILSPGPGRPDRAADARFSALALAPGRPPVLGVCLGMQLMAHHAGGRVVHAPTPRHGRLSPVEHDGTGLFAGVPSPAELVRYHSLACVDLPATLVPTARAADDGVLMALRHATLPWWGVQFHPESIASAFGGHILANFLREARVGARDVAAGWRAPGRSAPEPSIVEEAPGLPVLHVPVPRAVDPEGLRARHFRTAPSVWLDGAAAGTRWSILGDGAGPLAYTVSSRGGVLTVARRDGVEVREQPLLDFLREALAVRCPPVADLPFALGFVGAFGYELFAAPAAGRTAEAELVYLDRAVVIDHVNGTTHLLALEHPENRAWIDAIAAELSGPGAPTSGPSMGQMNDRPGHRFWAFPRPRGGRWPKAGWGSSTIALRSQPPPAPSGHPPPRRRGRVSPGSTSPLRRSCEGTARLSSRGPPRPLALAWRHDRAAYRERVLAAQAWLREGESYELCLTNEVRFPYDADPAAAYGVLRRVNPAPFAALLDFGTVAILSSSPERFLRVTAAGEVTAQPIKGTRRREAEPVADREASQALAQSEKERSENLMIVDLLRNDLGRVCAPGTVAVPSLYAVESFATVHQLVSTVTGRLRPGLGAVDALAAAFPPGSMTGAPKTRSVALLTTLEGGPRGFYAGAVGYLSRCGAADLSVLIRAAVIANGEASVGVGGAVVALSDPDAEVAEMELKAAAVLEALGRA